MRRDQEGSQRQRWPTLVYSNNTTRL